MVELVTKRGASFADLLAFISWCEIYIGTHMAQNGVLLTPNGYRHLRGVYAKSVGFPLGAASFTFHVRDAATRKKIRKRFPALIRKKRSEPAAHCEMRAAA
ncbi:MAG: hypothetical protein DI537_10460 [Stutzerimonas stutzeri]|nr:MAG: hypothetical protein DI537_10460 [Stutzerimonas stutzeri]